MFKFLFLLSAWAATAGCALLALGVERGVFELVDSGEPEDRGELGVSGKRGQGEQVKEGRNAEQEKIRALEDDKELVDVLLISKDEPLSAAILPQIFKGPSDSSFAYAGVTFNHSQLVRVPPPPSSQSLPFPLFSPSCKPPSHPPQSLPAQPGLQLPQNLTSPPAPQPVAPPVTSPPLQPVSPAPQNVTSQNLTSPQSATPPLHNLTSPPQNLTLPSQNLTSPSQTITSPPSLTSSPQNLTAPPENATAPHPTPPAPRNLTARPSASPPPTQPLLQPMSPPPKPAVQPPPPVVPFPKYLAPLPSDKANRTADAWEGRACGRCGACEGKSQGEWTKTSDKRNEDQGIEKTNDGNCGEETAPACNRGPCTQNRQHKQAQPHPRRMDPAHATPCRSCDYSQAYESDTPCDCPCHASQPTP